MFVLLYVIGHWIYVIGQLRFASLLTLRKNVAHSYFGIASSTIINVTSGIGQLESVEL